VEVIWVIILDRGSQFVAGLIRELNRILEIESKYHKWPLTDL